MLYLLLIIEIILLIVSYLMSGRKMTSPSCLVNLSFCFSTGLLCAYSDRWGLALHENTVWVICGGNFLFMVGEALSYLNGCPQRLSIRSSDIADVNINVKKSFSFFMILFIGVSALLVFRYIAGHTSIYYSPSGVASTLLGSYRKASSEITTSWMTALMTIGKITMYLYAYIIIFNLFVKKERVKIVELIVLVLSIALCSLSSARTDIIFLAGAVLIWLYGMFEYKSNSYHETSKRIIKYGVLILVSMFALFLFLGNFTGKTGKTITEMFDTVVIYSGSGTVGLDEYLQSYNGSQFSNGSETLYGLSSVLSKLGLGELTHYRNLEFFKIGESRYTSNIYTVYRRLFHDYGIVITMLIRVIEGYVFGKMYKRIYSSGTTKIFFRRLLIFGSLVGILVTEPVDTYFLMIIPTITEVITVVAFVLFYDVVMSKSVQLNGSKLTIDRNV